MKKAIMAVLCLAFTACSFAGMEARRAGRYHVNGYTTDPDSTVRAVSDAVVQETYADAYKEAVQNGMAYPYYGGAVGNDYSFYGYNGIMPPATVSPQGQVPAQAVDPQARETAEQALKKADRSLEYHKRLRQTLTGSAEEGGSQ